MEKNIKDFLHLYLGCEVYIFPDHTYRDGWLDGALERYPDLEFAIKIDHTNISRIIQHGYKPILRKLSSMTEEEMDEMWYNMDGPVQIEFQKDGKCRRFDSTPNQVVYLLSRGFDLFGLLESNLAIEKKEEQMKAEDEDIEYIDPEDDDDGEPDYYECLSCSYSCVQRPAFGGQCPKCGCHMEEGYF